MHGEAFAVDGQAVIECEENYSASDARLDMRWLAERFSPRSVTRTSATGHHVEVERGAARDRGFDRTLARECERLVGHEIDPTIAFVQGHRAVEQHDRAIHVIES